MKWINYKNIEELKANNFKEVKQELKEVFGDRVEVKARSWEDLWELILNLRKIVFCNTDDSEYDSIYFKSNAARSIYALVELDGEYRARELGINIFHYRDEKKAKQWYTEIVKAIHPDVCSHPKASLAFSTLNTLYKRMKGN